MSAEDHKNRILGVIEQTYGAKLDTLRHRLTLIEQLTKRMVLEDADPELVAALCHYQAYLNMTLRICDDAVNNPYGDEKDG